MPITEATTVPPIPPSIFQWRSMERRRLRAERLALSADDRSRRASLMAAHLDRLLAALVGDVKGFRLSAYWPIKGEFDMRAWMADLHARGVQVSLPVVEQVAAPLVFRIWQPEMKMDKGFWNIPVPPADSPTVIPQVSLAPLVGWDAAGYRLGYGGGYFDRTLAALSPRPFVIGVGLSSAQIPTILPQPHDIKLDAIVTEHGLEPLTR